MNPLLARRIATFCVLAFIGLLLWRLTSKAGQDRELVYDLSRVGRTDLVGLQVALRRDGALVREAEYFYRGPEGSAPTQQRHRVRLPDGSYVGTFTLSFRKAPTDVRQTVFVIDGAETQVVPLPAPALPSPAAPAQPTAPHPTADPKPAAP